MRVAIAGCGDLGIAIARVLQARGDRVLGLRRRPEALPDGIAAMTIDLVSGDVDRVPRDVDAVVYSPTPSTRDEAGYRTIYVEAQRRWLAHFSTAHWVFVSSTAVYGDSGGRVDERSPPAPTGFNGRVLVEAEQLALSRQGRVVRLAGIYGPGREMLLRRARRQEPARAAHYTNRIHIDDAAALCVRMLERDAPAIVNGVDDEPCSEAEVLTWLAAAMRLPAPARIEAPPSGKCVDNRLARSLGWQPLYASYREGYTAMLAQAPASL